MAVVFSKPQNRFASRVGRKGLSRAVALEQATDLIESLRLPTIDYIDENLSVLFKLFAQTDDATSPPYIPLYDASNAIAGTAALFGLEPMGTGAFNLCELLAYLEHRNTWNSAAVKLFLDGLAMMRQLSPKDESVDAKLMLENLNQLLYHVTMLSAHSTADQDL